MLHCRAGLTPGVETMQFLETGIERSFAQSKRSKPPGGGGFFDGVDGVDGVDSGQG